MEAEPVYALESHHYEFGNDVYRVTYWGGDEWIDLTTIEIDYPEYLAIRKSLESIPVRKRVYSGRSQYAEYDIRAQREAAAAAEMERHCAYELQGTGRF